MKRSGVALVITLALIVLVSAAVLAFFSSATFNRRIEFSRTSRAKADLLANSGGTYAIGRIFGDITAAAHSSKTTTLGVTVYQPIASSNAYPERHLLSGISLSSGTFANLIRQSEPVSDSNVSNHKTSDAASNGRYLNASRWNAPCLLSGSGFSSSAQLPNWIYMDRRTGVTKTLTKNVIGRLSYNIYNIGGLLNANMAGCPAAIAADSNGPAWMTYLKPNEGGANLVLLSSSISQTNVDALSSFRFPDGPTAQSYVGRILGSATNGYLSVQGVDWFSGNSFKQSMFASRQDLIRYARTKNTNLVAALPYLTHFSRAVNRPGWKPPTTPANTNPDVLNVRFPTVATVAHYDDKGGKTTYSVAAGDPLVQRRFSLSKLAWLTPRGVASGITDDAIQACFGLQWNKTEERWNYVGASGSDLQGTIKTLTEVAAETPAREPNFFEYLKAGICSYTLGASAVARSVWDAGSSHAATACGKDSLDVDKSKDLHLIQIGANIIDSADSDNFPTRIAMGFGSIAVEKAGIEDLPYFYSMDMAMLFVAEQLSAPVGTNTHKITGCDFVWVPELFALHRPSTATETPESLQVDIASGSLLQVGIAGGGAFSDPSSKQAMDLSASPKDLSVLPAISVPSDKFENFRKGPAPISDSSASNALGQTAPAADPSIADLVGFHLFSFGSEFTKTFPFNIAADDRIGAVGVQSMIIRLRYKTPGGKMKTYATLGGNEALPNTGLYGCFRDDFDFSAFKQSARFTQLVPLEKNRTIHSPYLLPWDPRTARFGPAYGLYVRQPGQVPNFTNVTAVAELSNGSLQDAIWDVKPFYPDGKTSKTANLPQAPAFKDPDGTYRQPDAGLGYNSSNLKSNTANPYLDLTNYNARPVILQRAYRSVAELGYVFRDIPWQSLNFFNSNSGDAALLDFFSVLDEPAFTAGRVALGTPNQAVLEALADGAAQEPDGSLVLSSSNSTTPKTVAAALNSYAFASGTATATFPVNAADLAKFMSSSGISTISSANLSYIKNRREAFMRVLAGSQSNTWNFLIDVVAQTGRFPGSNMTAEGFAVEGESRWWISVAIDRYTGKIVDQQVEKVNE